MMGSKYNGQGVKTYTNGDKYDGDLKDDLPNGRGVITYASGNKYDGEWKDNQQNGRGVLTYANGNKYDGEYKDGKQNWRLEFIDKKALSELQTEVAELLGMERGEFK